MMQKQGIADIFKKYFSLTTPPSRIIELGCYTREFSFIIYKIRESMGGDFKYFAIDFIKYPTQMPEEIWVNDSKKLIYCELDIQSNMDFIISLIREDTLILCDNGNKINEVRTIAPHMKDGCVIMAHDYFETLDDFKKQEEWMSCEITYADVSDLGLDKHCYDLMKGGYWLSLRKK